MRILILASCLVMITIDCLSQQKEQKVKKGYYSIGSNSQLIAAIDSSNIIQHLYVPDPYSQSPKGYYSPEEYRRKIPWRTMKEQRKEILIPIITKGYYSIGRNALQLKK